MYNLVEELKGIVAELEKHGLPYALAGGLAVGIYTEPRATIDIDLVVKPADLEKIVETLQAAGFEKFSEPMPLEKAKMKIQRLVKLEPGQPEVLMLDLCMPDQQKYPEVWKDWQKVPMGEVQIQVLSKNGLIQMKKGRGSEKDLADIKALGGKSRH